MTFQPVKETGFFVGYFKKVPPSLHRFLIVAGVCLLAGFSVLGAVLSFATDDPGAGGYVGDNSVVLTGVMEVRPYPVLRIPATATRPAEALMLAAEDKEGVETGAAPFAGQVVEVSGVLLKRGDLNMMLVTDPLRQAKATPDTGVTSAPASVPLGRWRLTGEICDGKCYVGAMKPGAGLAHKACANLCLTGGAPPVLVTRLPVDGKSFFLLADASGGPLGPEILQSTAVPVSIDGTLEMRDDMPVFRVDAGSIRRVP